VPEGVGAMLFRLGRAWPIRSTAVRLPVDRFFQADDL
jgi:hypothetical protein